MSAALFGAALGERREEPGRGLAGLLAIGVHVVVISLLVTGFRVPRPDSAPVIAELWSALPPLPQAEPPQPPPLVERPPPKPAPRIETPKPEPARAAEKADIELREKLAREKAAREQQEREKKAAEDKLRLLEQRRREEEQLRQALARAEAAKEAEAARVRREQEELQRKLAEAAAAAQRRLVAEFTDRIRARVRQFIVLPPDVPPAARAEFIVTLIPGGQVLSVKLVRPSGHALYDEAVERAIRRADPLPVPADAREFHAFRELRLQFTPQE